jgi:large subunit ribosomal protein L24
VRKSLIKVNDEVQVIRGGQSGRRTASTEEKGNPIGERGRIRKVLRDSGRVIVDRVRMVKKATRPDPRKGHRGGFVEKEAPLPLSAVMLVCKKCDRPVRARVQRDAEGHGVRVCRRCGEAI